MGSDCNLQSARLQKFILEIRIQNHLDYKTVLSKPTCMVAIFSILKNTVVIKQLEKLEIIGLEEPSLFGIS